MKQSISILLITLLGLTTFACAEEPLPNLSESSAKATILEFGLFETVGPQQQIANQNTLDGAERNSSGARFTEQTDKIQAKLGAQFGFRYKMTGITEQGYADFKMVVKHPPIKNEKGEIEQQYSTSESLPTKNGYVSEVTGYSLDRQEELVPGLWTFEIWYHGQKLVSKSFTICVQDERAAGTEKDTKK